MTAAEASMIVVDLTRELSAMRGERDEYRRWLIAMMGEGYRLNQEIRRRDRQIEHLRQQVLTTKDLETLDHGRAA